MTRVKWQPNAVFSVGLRGNVWALGQMTEHSPFVMFFDAFAVDDEWTVSDTTTLRPLSICAPLGQFFRWSVVRKKKSIRPTTPTPWPEYWLRRGPSWDCRDVTLWPGTAGELVVPDVSVPDRVRLVPREEVLGRAHTPPVSRWTLVSPTDVATVEKYEFDRLRSSPAVNERLWISYQLKQLDPSKSHNVDPDKCVELGLPVPEQCREFFLMRQRRSVEGMDFIRERPEDP